MTREELVNAMDAINKLLTERVQIFRVIVNPHGEELRRVHRGSFQARAIQRTSTTFHGGRHD